MAEWKKVIVSGSNAELNQITASSINSTFVGNGAGITDLAAAAVTTAGALMDSEVTSLALIKGLTAATISGSLSATSVASAGALMDSEVTSLALIKSITAATISGSFTSLSSSVASDVATNTAKVTANTSNVTSAGALMDSEVTSLALIKGLTAATISGSISATSVAAAGALMDSELTDLASVKAIDQGLATGDNVTFANLSATGDVTLGNAISDDINISGNVTASGDISASGTITAKTLTADLLVSHTGDANTGLQFGSDTVSIEANNVVVAGFKSLEIELNLPVTASSNISSSGYISASVFVGDGSQLTGVAADSFDIDALNELSDVPHATQDEFIISDNGTEKRISHANVSLGVVRTAATTISGAISATSVASAGALMDSEVTSLALIKGLTAATISGSISATSVAAAGALMDSELTDLASVKAINQSLVTTADVTFGAIEVTGNATFGNGTTDLHTFTGNITASNNISASNTITAKLFKGNGGLLTNVNVSDIGETISGSFTSLSSSIASDVATNTAKLTANTSNVTSAGALMDSEVTSLALIKSITAATISGSSTSLSSSVASDVATNTAKLTANTSNVTSAGALMDSELTDLAAVKAIDQGLATSDNVTFANVTATGNLEVQGTVTTLNTANLNVEDQFILLNSGSNSKDVGIVFGGTSGTNQRGKALVWDYNYNGNDGRLGISSTDVLHTNTSAIDFSGTNGYYVAGVYLGSESDAETAKADHPGNIRVESSEIYIYV